MNNQLLPLLNQRNQMNGLHLLDLLDGSSVKVVFFDPQYRGILELQKQLILATSQENDLIVFYGLFGCES